MRLRTLIIVGVLLLIALLPQTREALLAPIWRHVAAVSHGRQLEGFPPDQLSAYEASLAAGELEVRAVLLGELTAAQRDAQLGRLERIKVRKAEAIQERLWYQIGHHPVQSAGAALLALGLVVVAIQLLGGLGSARDARETASSVDNALKKVLPQTLLRRRPRSPEDVPLPIPPESEVERLIGDPESAVDEAPTPLVLDHSWEGWGQAVRDRVPTLEMPHLIALFASDPSRNYLGLLGFLSHQLALAGADLIRILPGQKGVQIFISTPEHEQEIGELPSHHYPRLVGALTATLDMNQGEREDRPRRTARLLAPSEEGYQVQELTLFDNALELRALEHVRFLPAGW